MNPDDPNNPQGGGSTPPAADQGGTAAPASEPMGGGEPAPAAPDMGGGAPAGGEAPTDVPAATCHCGKPSSGGTCTGCNLPEASCSCQPTA